MEYAQEYIELFDKNKELIEKPCASLLNAERAKAFLKFKESGFPGIKEENWLHTNVARRFVPDYGMNLGRVAANIVPQDTFTCDVPNLKTYRAYIVNDSFVQSDNNRPLPKGVIIGSLNEVAASNPTLLEPYYNRLAEKGDSIVQFNTAFVQEGVVIYIPRNCEMEETIQLVALLHSNVDMLCNRRMLIIMEENSSASLLLCDHSSSSQQTLSTSVTEIFMAKGASLDLYELEETSPGNTRLGNLYVHQDSDSRFNHSNITLTNGFTRNRVEILLNGKGAECCINGLAIGDKRQHIDNRTLVEHKCSHTASNELYKYILDEESTGVFAGKMLIRTDAQQTVSHQTNRNLCLTTCAPNLAAQLRGVGWEVSEGRAGFTAGESRGDGAAIEHRLLPSLSSESRPEGHPSNVFENTNPLYASTKKKTKKGVNMEKENLFKERRAPWENSSIFIFIANIACLTELAVSPIYQRQLVLQDTMPLQ